MDSEKEKIKQKLLDIHEDYLSLKVDVLPKNPEPLTFLREYVNRSRPCLIKNGYNQLLKSNLPSVKTDHEYLSHELLKNKYGEKNVTVSVTPNGLADAVHDNKFTLPFEETISIKELYSKLESVKPSDRKSQSQILNQAYYYYQKQNSSVTDELPDLIDNRHILNSIPFADQALSEKFDAVNIWLGNSHSVTSLHKDPYENMYAVIEGKKIFKIANPIFMPYMDYKEYPTFEWVFDKEKRKDEKNELKWDLKAKDFDTRWIEKYDDDKVRIQTVEVEAGDLFYLPSFWFHQVEQEDMTLAVNYWYDTGCGSF